MAEGAQVTYKQQNIGIQGRELIQGVSGGKVIILGGDSIGHCGHKDSY
jgi:hypothetical protein